MSCGAKSRPIRRLQQTANHLSASPPEEETSLSIVHGPLSPPLQEQTLCQLLDLQASARGEQECLVIAYTSVRWTYSELQVQSVRLAKGLLALGLRKGDRIGILASNCEEYVASFFAAGLVGAILVVLNSGYTCVEASHALQHSGCKILLVEEKYGRQSNKDLLRELEHHPQNFPDLKTVAILRGSHPKFISFSQVVSEHSLNVTDEQYTEAKALVHTHDVCNIQYTSGSTGDPKAAMLTNFNLLNNARSIGLRLALTPSDILCCPPPLFHCFGLVLGLLTTLIAGGKFVVPSPTFSAPAVLSALADERCTALHGVPAMFEELLSVPRPNGWKVEGLRTGIIAGAPVPRPLMKRLVEELGMREFTSSYGLTEASPTCFNAEHNDSIDIKLNTVGKIMPHLHAKIVDREGRIVKVGEKGELCISGYSIMRGYWRNETKTREAVRKDEKGVEWLFTGDEALFLKGGYCKITGRFKDIIIRGGENIYPLEIESRLTSHPSSHISRAAVIGIPHHKYGEVVGAFLLPAPESFDLDRPTDEELRVWVRKALGWHKAPVHVFWLDDLDVGDVMGEMGEMGVEMPQTGSGKVKKHVLRKIADTLVNGEKQKENLVRMVEEDLSESMF